MVCDGLDRVARTDLALCRYGQVAARAPAEQELLDQLLAAEATPELVAGQPRLRYD